MDKDQIQVFKDYKDHILEGQFPGIGSLEGQFPGVDLDFPFEGDFTESMYGYHLEFFLYLDKMKRRSSFPF